LAQTHNIKASSQPLKPPQTFLSVSKNNESIYS
jgi:hypothetical protein